LWSELQYALAIDPNEEDVDEARKPFKNAIIRLCSPLIEHQIEEDVFRPIHRSVNEFISRPQANAEETETIKRFCTPKKEAHAVITATCLVSLSMPEIAESVVFNWEQFPLAAYATSDWCHHLTQSESEPLLKQRLQQFITSLSRRRTWQARWLIMDMNTYPLQRLMKAQRTLQSWIQSSNCGADVNFDYLEDMFNVLLDLDSRDKILDAVWTTNELGRVYRHLQNLDESALAHKEALKILEPILPENDTHIVWTINCLARTYRFQDRLEEALTLHLQAYESQKKLLSEGHPHTLWTMSDIAQCLRDQGRYLDAYQTQLQVLEGRQKALGLEHSDTCWSMNDVGLSLTQLGRRKEAKIYHEKAWATQKVLLGEDNTMTMWTRNLLDTWTVEEKLS
jgi:tetratricopeptide (TPR) repeat protein